MRPDDKMRIRLAKLSKAELIELLFMNALVITERDIKRAKQIALFRKVNRQADEALSEMKRNTATADRAKFNRARGRFQKAKNILSKIFLTTENTEIHGK